MRWLLTGDRFDAAEALRLGIVQEVVEEAELFERALSIAQRIAAQAPLAVQATRESALIATEQGADVAAARLMAPARALMQTDDIREAVRRFVQA